jgi:hypothetical protein
MKIFVVIVAIIIGFIILTINDSINKSMSQSDINEIEINGVQYIRKDSIKTKAETLDGLPYVIVRTYSAGVFAGYLKSRNGKEVVMLNARRIWQWAGAASLSQLAMEGTKKPLECKFPCKVDKVELTEAIEVLYCTEVAYESIKEVPVWKI